MKTDKELAVELASSYISAFLGYLEQIKSILLW